MSSIVLSNGEGFQAVANLIVYEDFFQVTFESVRDKNEDLNSIPIAKRDERRHAVIGTQDPLPRITDPTLEGALKLAHTRLGGMAQAFYEWNEQNPAIVKNKE